MKIKPVNSNTDTSIKETRYNKNILEKYSQIKPGTFNMEKRNYSAISLLSLMYESGFVKPDNIKESFDTSKKYIDKYEGRD